MAINRQNIKKRILDILTYIENNTLAFPLKQNISLFSLKELEQLLEFLESGNLQPIYNFLDEKQKEYLSVIEQVKQLKMSKIKNKILEEEKIEKKSEEKELDLLINF